ncbi:hypothetical protein BC940DRAFT_347115 [Gongronella butleri]|nr:hypothetical protein BC940DRAFT_347115 [Gongronella butleri]
MSSCRSHRLHAVESDRHLQSSHSNRRHRVKKNSTKRRIRNLKRELKATMHSQHEMIEEQHSIVAAQSEILDMVQHVDKVLKDARAGLAASLQSQNAHSSRFSADSSRPLAATMDNNDTTAMDQPQISMTMGNNDFPAAAEPGFFPSYGIYCKKHALPTIHELMKQQGFNMELGDFVWNDLRVACRTIYYDFLNRGVVTIDIKWCNIDEAIRQEMVTMMMLKVQENVDLDLAPAGVKFSRYMMRMLCFTSRRTWYRVLSQNLHNTSALNSDDWLQAWRDRPPRIDPELYQTLSSSSLAAPSSFSRNLEHTTITQPQHSQQQHFYDIDDDDSDAASHHNDDDNNNTNQQQPHHDNDSNWWSYTDHLAPFYESHKQQSVNNDDMMSTSHLLSNASNKESDFSSTDWL